MRWCGIVLERRVKLSNNTDGSDENGGVPPERKVYSYQNMRAKVGRTRSPRGQRTDPSLSHGVTKLSSTT